MELFERIRLLSSVLEISLSKIAICCGSYQQKFNQWLNAKSQKNLWEHLPKILEAFPQVRREWLYFEDGEMLKDGDGPKVSSPNGLVSHHVASSPSASKTVPVIGFAACGVRGWSGKMTYPVAAAAPHARPDMIAVMASGESMLPAGIGHGHICFCDPHAEPMPGECVYIEHSGGMASLKVYMGRGEEAGGETRAGEICLKGWLDKRGGDPQKEFLLITAQELVTLIAPVIYIQRRI